MKYLSKYEAKTKPVDKEVSITREYCKIARKKLIRYIEEEIVNQHRVLSLLHLRNSYVEILRSLYDSADVEVNSSFRTYFVKEFILQSLRSKVTEVILGKKSYFMSKEVSI